MGVFGVGRMNDNGQTLLEFCNMNELVVTNTMFNHRSVHECTWTSPDGTTMNLTDYVLVNMIRRTSIPDTCVYTV